MNKGKKSTEKSLSIIPNVHTIWYLKKVNLNYDKRYGTNRGVTQIQNYVIWHYMSVVCRDDIRNSYMMNSFELPTSIVKQVQRSIVLWKVKACFGTGLSIIQPMVAQLSRMVCLCWYWLLVHVMDSWLTGTNNFLNRCRRRQWDSHEHFLSFPLFKIHLLSVLKHINRCVLRHQ